MNDAQLHRLLRESPAQIPLPASFTREVWSRIEVEGGSTPGMSLSQAWGALLGMLSRPAPAFATIAVCMLLGGGFGLLTSANLNEQRGALAYAESINPLMRPGREVPR